MCMALSLSDIWVILFGSWKNERSANHHKFSTWNSFVLTTKLHFNLRFHPLERKWRLKPAAMCGLAAISCSIIYIIIKFVFYLQPQSAGRVYEDGGKLVSTWSIIAYCMCDARVPVLLLLFTQLSRNKGKKRRKISKLQLTFSCLKKHNIFSSLNTRFDETSDWNTLGSFLRATRRPSRGSVTALEWEEEEIAN